MTTTIPETWKLRSIESVCTRVTTGGTPSRRKPEFFENGTIPWFKTGELKDQLLFDSEEHITDEALESSSAKVLPSNTVLMAMYGDGDTITTLGVLRRPAATNQACCAMMPDPSICEWRYLFYALKHTRPDLLRVVVGGAQRNLSGSIIRQHSIPLPPLAEQKAIASILGALDDKIELNRRMNATLEGMARALFQSWFVDFDPVRAKLDGRKPEGMDKATAALFPDAFEHTSDGEMVPKGWKMKCTADLFEVRDGTHDSPKRREHGFPLITSKHITNGGVDIENAYLISEEDFIQVNKRSKVDKFDTLMTMIGTVGVPLLVHEREPNFAIKNIGLFKTSKAREFSYYFYLYLISPEMQQFLKSRLAGTTQAFLSLGILRSLPILVPDSSLLLAFNKVCEQLFGIIATNRHQTDTLANLRDTLLPKLLSGELSVASIPKVKA